MTGIGIAYRTQANAIGITKGWEIKNRRLKNNRGSPVGRDRRTKERRNKGIAVSNWIAKDRNKTDKYDDVKEQHTYFGGLEGIANGAIFEVNLFIKRMPVCIIQ